MEARENNPSCFGEFRSPQSDAENCCNDCAHDKECHAKWVDSRINNPAHYTRGKYELTPVIEDWGLGWHLGNAIKYIMRAEHKGKTEEDLRKAIWYIERFMQYKQGEKTENKKVYDPINPAYYKWGKYEVVDVIKDWSLGFCLGNATKYIARAGHKDPTKLKEDLQKAVWYIEKYVEQECAK